LRRVLKSSNGIISSPGEDQPHQPPPPIDPHLLLLTEAKKGHQSLDPVLYNQYTTREYFPPVGLEEVFARDEGRPAASLLLRPLRIIAYKVMGMSGIVVETVRHGVDLVEEEVFIDPLEGSLHLLNRYLGSR